MHHPIDETRALEPVTSAAAPRAEASIGAHSRLLSVENRDPTALRFMALWYGFCVFAILRPESVTGSPLIAMIIGLPFLIDGLRQRRLSIEGNTIVVQRRLLVGWHDKLRIARDEVIGLHRREIDDSDDRLFLLLSSNNKHVEIAARGVDDALVRSVAQFIDNAPVAALNVARAKDRRVE